MTLQGWSSVSTIPRRPHVAVDGRDGAGSSPDHSSSSLSSHPTLHSSAHNNTHTHTPHSTRVRPSKTHSADSPQASSSARPSSVTANSSPSPTASQHTSSSNTTGGHKDKGDKGGKHTSAIAPFHTQTAKIGPGNLNATLPSEGFTQCQPAYVGIQADADQAASVTVEDPRNIMQRLDATLPPPVSGWSWDTVDFRVGTQLRIEIAVGGGDVSSPRWASWVGSAPVFLGANNTDCLTNDDYDSDSDSSDSSDNSDDINLGTILGTSIPLSLLLLGLLVGMLFFIIHRRKKRAPRQQGEADGTSAGPLPTTHDSNLGENTPDTREFDPLVVHWQDGLSGTQGMRPPVGLRLQHYGRSWSLDAISPSAAFLEHRDAPYDPLSPPSLEEKLPTYRQSQRDTKRLPSYTRASTFTRATPLHSPLSQSFVLGRRSHRGPGCARGSRTISLAPAEEHREQSEPETQPRTQFQDQQSPSPQQQPHQLQRSQDDQPAGQAGGRELQAPSARDSEECCVIQFQQPPLSQQIQHHEEHPLSPGQAVATPFLPASPVSPVSQAPSSVSQAPSSVSHASPIGPASSPDEHHGAGHVQPRS